MMSTREIGVRAPRNRRERSIFSYIYEATGLGLLAVMFGVMLVIYSSFVPTKADVVLQAGGPAGFAGAKRALPIRRGAYALVGRSCDAGASYGRYDDLLSYSGDGLNNSSMTRAIIGLSSKGPRYDLRLRSEGVGDNDKPETVLWTIVVTNREFFTVVGHDHGNDRSGSYRFCGTDALHSDRWQADIERDHIAMRDGATLDGAQGRLFDHNGSDVLYFADKGLIVYARPKASMNRVVRTGDVLFRGTVRDHVLVGEAYAFKAGCRPVAYEVQGVLSNETDWEGARLHLHGAAPTWDRASCRVVSSTYDTPNASLAFTQLRGPDLEARIGGEPYR